GVDNYSVYLVGGALGNTASISLGTAYASQKSFTFTLPSTVQSGSGYQIQFSGKYVSGDNSPSFNIQGSQPASPFNITFPTSGSNLQEGQTYSVTWTGSDTGVDNYSVYLVGGSLGNTASIPLGTAYASNHSFSFTVPMSVQAGSGFQIQLSGKYASGGNSPSFTITPPPPFTITFPTSNSTLKIGQTYNLTWTGADAGVDNYSVYLVGGALGNTASVALGTAYASQKSFSWTVPSSVQPSTGYQIQFSGKYVSGDNSPSFTISQ
ncbi:MAG: Ser-Thr-rich GPI-anchored membrane family protein, partial [Candidatus Taylorbacteria bacterium]